MVLQERKVSPEREIRASAAGSERYLETGILGIRIDMLFVIMGPSVKSVTDHIINCHEWHLKNIWRWQFVDRIELLLPESGG